MQSPVDSSNAAVHSMAMVLNLCLKGAGAMTNARRLLRPETHRSSTVVHHQAPLPFVAFAQYLSTALQCRCQMPMTFVLQLLYCYTGRSAHATKFMKWQSGCILLLNTSKADDSGPEYSARCNVQALRAALPWSGMRGPNDELHLQAGTGQTRSCRCQGCEPLAASCAQPVKHQDQIAASPW